MKIKEIREHAGQLCFGRFMFQDEYKNSTIDFRVDHGFKESVQLEIYDNAGCEMKLYASDNNLRELRDWLCELYGLPQSKKG